MAAWMQPGWAACVCCSLCILDLTTISKRLQRAWLPQHWLLVFDAHQTELNCLVRCSFVGHQLPTSLVGSHVVRFQTLILQRHLLNCVESFKAVCHKFSQRISKVSHVACGTYKQIHLNSSLGNCSRGSLCLSAPAWLPLAHLMSLINVIT